MTTTPLRMSWPIFPEWEERSRPANGGTPRDGDRDPGRNDRRDGRTSSKNINSHMQHEKKS